MRRILVTNDDGIDAAGIRSLTEALGRLPDAVIYVFAPSGQRSSVGQSISYGRDVKAEETEYEGAEAAYAVDGTPADCVKLGLLMLSERGIVPDYVFSGINKGFNPGPAVYYSGTVGAAREGAFAGIRSVALSKGNGETEDFEYFAEIIPQLLELSGRLGPSVVLNVNVPALPADRIRGLRTAPAAPYAYAERYELSRGEDGVYRYGTETLDTDGRMRYDCDWLRAGYAVASPLPSFSEDPVSLLKLREQTLSAEFLAVIVDAQEETLEGLRKPNRFRRSLRRFARAAGRMNIPVILTETFGRGELLQDVIQYADCAERVERSRPDAWTAPELENYARVSGAGRVLIAGAATNIEVLQTAAGFIGNGYEVTVLADCCSAASKQEHVTALEELREIGCRVSVCSTALMEVAAYCEKGVRKSVEEILRDR